MKTFITGLKHDAQVAQKARDAVLDDFVYWMINKSNVVGYAHILDAVEKYKIYLDDWEQMRAQQGGER
jgi:hypothetical protein